MQNYTAEYELSMKYQCCSYRRYWVCGLYSLSRAPRTGKWKPTNHLLVSQSKNGTGTGTGTKTGTLTNRKRKVEIGEGENFRIANATDICQSRKPSQQVNNNLQIFSPNAESNPHDHLGYLIPSVTDFWFQVKTRWKENQLQTNFYKVKTL